MIVQVFELSNKHKPGNMIALGKTNEIGAVFWEEPWMIESDRQYLVKTVSEDKDRKKSVKIQ